MLGHGSCSQSTQRSCWVLELIDDSVGIWLVKVCEQLLFDCGFDNGPWSAPQQQEAAAYGAYVHAHDAPNDEPNDDESHDDGNAWDDESGHGNEPDDGRCCYEPTHDDAATAGCQRQRL